MTPLTRGNAALWPHPEVGLNHRADTCSLDLELNAYSCVCQISHQYHLQQHLTIQMQKYSC